MGFHSIDVPSEWGQDDLQGTSVRTKKVSIQLMSPASGDLKYAPKTGATVWVSIQLMSPASGDVQKCSVKVDPQTVSIQLMSPASGDLKGSPKMSKVLLALFPFN